MSSSLANFFLQWGVAFVLLGLLNEWMVRRVDVPLHELRSTRSEAVELR